MAAAFSQVSALAELLKEPESHNPRINENVSGIHTPGQIGALTSENAALKSETIPSAQSNDIWNVEEVPECQEFEYDADPRQEPEYEMCFKQKVTSEDMFLGISGRNPSTACCEDLVVKIILEDTDFPDVQLNVTDSFLDCQTPKYKLVLHFPQCVDSDKGKARWEAEKKLLTVTVPMKREYDFLNNV